MKDINSVVSSPTNNIPLAENVVNYEEKRYSSQYKDKEVESYASSDEGEFVDPAYCEEVSYEFDDEDCYSSQGEDSHSVCSS